MDASTPPLDETLSRATAEQIGSKAKFPFENAYKAALATAGATYVQGFLVRAGYPPQPLEHAWIEAEERLIDPNLPYLGTAAADLYYFPAQRLSVKKLKAAIEEAQEDYPEDSPLPIYGSQPYEYYGDVMLGGKEYLAAQEAALAKGRELNRPRPKK